jgi:hypothetical protein
MHDNPDNQPSAALTTCWANHRVPNLLDRASVLARLSPTAPDIVRLRDYWRQLGCIDETFGETWIAGEGRSHGYSGPGGFCLALGAHVAWMSTFRPYAWFALVPQHQAALVTAFRSVTRALGGNRVVVMPDYLNLGRDLTHDNDESLDECVARLQKRCGDPHPRIGALDESWDVYKRREFPVWYLETLNDAS